jgi:hypothetical protein
MRKNFNFSDTKCKGSLPGVDINRNFDSSFATVSSSDNPCGEEYHGVAPFSESEAQVFKEIFDNLKVILAIDVHSYGNEWIYPYASDSTGNKLK